MPKPADTSTKKIISLAPDNWVKWVTQIPDIKAQEVINSEFQWISRESDVLIRAQSPQRVTIALQIRNATKDESLCGTGTRKI